MRSIMRLLQYIMSLMIMLIIKEMPNIVSLFGGLQIQPSLNYMPRNKMKGPLFVSDLFYERYLIS